MAWNEPGGKGESPWGRRPAGQNGGGGAGLDGALASLQRRLEALLRGSRYGAGGAGPGDDGGGRLGLWVAVLCAVLWLGTGFYKVDASERAVVQRFGRFIAVHDPGAGWALPWPIDTVTKVNISRVNSFESRSRMLTADVNLVDIHSAIQFQYADPVKVLFQMREPENTLREVGESAIREVIGQATLEDVLGPGRQQISLRTRELIQRTLDVYNSGVHVISVNLTEVQVPEAVLPSQRDANKAIEDKDRFSKEAQAYANDILPKADGVAQRYLLDAQAYKSQVVAQAEGDVARFESVYAAYSQSPEVTRQRMYIEAIEQMLMRSRKIVIDAKGGANGNVLYLPLDRLVERAGGTRATPLDTPPAVAPAATPARPGAEMEQVTIEGRDSRSRGER